MMTAYRQALRDLPAQSGRQSLSKLIAKSTSTFKRLAFLL